MTYIDNREESAFCQEQTHIDNSVNAKNRFKRASISKEAQAIHSDKIAAKQKKAIDRALKALEHKKRELLSAQGDKSFGAQKAATTKSVAKATKKGKGPGKAGAGEIVPTVSYEWAEEVLSGQHGTFAWENQDHSGLGVLYRWNDVIWDEFSDTRMNQMVGRWLHATRPHQARKATIKDATAYTLDIIGAHKPLPTRTKQYVMAVQNAYLHIDDQGEITVKAPDAALGITHAAKARISTSIGSTHVPEDVPDDSLFGTFLRKSLPDKDIRALVQEQCAMTFLPRSLHKAIWWWGDGRNGKGVLSKIIQAFHARPVSIRLDKLDTDFGLEHIVGASLLVVDEVRKKRFDEETFKPLVSADALHVGRKHIRALPTYYNHASVMVCSNNQPFITDNSNGTHERICSVHWNVVIPEKERVKDLDQKIVDNEGHIVVDWLLQGIQRLLRRGGFRSDSELPKTVLAHKRQLRIQNDTVGAWIDEHGVEHDESVRVSKESIYSAFAEWCQADGREVLSANVFWRELWAKQAFALHTKERLHTSASLGKRLPAVNIAITGIAKEGGLPISTPAQELSFVFPESNVEIHF